MGAVDRDYSQFDNRDQLIEALETKRAETAQTAASALPGQQASVGDLAEARASIADEEPLSPDDPLPDLTHTEAVPFRGHVFEFTELGDTVLDAATMKREVEGDDEIDENSAFAEFVYSILEEKCTHPDADEAYWRQFDLQRSDDVDSILDLFFRVMEAGADLDAGARATAETFRDE